MQTVARLESSDISNPASRLRNLDCEIWSLAAWSIHGWVFSLAAEPAPQLLKALQNYNENKPAKRPHPWEPPRRTLCRTLARWLVLRLLQQSQFNAFHKKLTKPEEIEALSVQMFVARLTKKQDKYLVHIRPDHAARVERSNRCHPRLGTLAGSTFQILARLAPMAQTYASSPKARAREKERMTTTLHGRCAARSGCLLPLPRLAVLRGLHSELN